MVNRESIVYKAYQHIKYPFLNETEKALFRYYWDGGNEKIRYNYNVSKTDIVFDVGGVEGSWASHFAGKCKLYVFEPQSKYSSILNHRFEGVENVYVFPFGLDKETHVGSISMENEGGSQYHGIMKESAQFKSISEFLEEEESWIVTLIGIYGCSDA